MKFFKSNKIYKLAMTLFVIYSVGIFANQQSKLNAYRKEKEYYETRISSLNDEKSSLMSIKENINSPKYIEEVARENLDMYLPNERVYIDVSK